jgi:site-specific recombinase XerC
LQLKTNRLSFNGQPIARSGGDFDSRYSQRGVQWAVKTVAKSVGITKDVHAQSTSYLCHAFARRRHGYYHAQRPLGHQNLETTLEYLQIAQLESQQKFSPLDTLLRNAQVADVLRKLGKE